MDNNFGSLYGKDVSNGLSLFGDESQNQDNGFSLFPTDTESPSAGQFGLDLEFSNQSNQALAAGLASGLAPPDMATSMLAPNGSTKLGGIMTDPHTNLHENLQAPFNLGAELPGMIDPQHGNLGQDPIPGYNNELESQGFFKDLSDWLCTSDFIPGCTPKEKIDLGNWEKVELQCTPPTCEKLREASPSGAFITIKDGLPGIKLSAKDSVDVNFKNFTINELELKAPSNGQPFRLSAKIGETLVPMVGTYWKFDSGVELFVGGGTNDGCNLHHRAELKIPLKVGADKGIDAVPVQAVRDWLNCSSELSANDISYSCEGKINVCGDGSTHHIPPGVISMNNDVLIVAGAAALAALAIAAPDLGVLVGAGVLAQAAN